MQYEIVLVKIIFNTIKLSFFSAFIRAGLKGHDMSKREKREIPEALGVVSGAVFLIAMFLFIPIPFYQNLKDGIFHSRNNSETVIKVGFSKTIRLSSTSSVEDGK